MRISATLRRTLATVAIGALYLESPAAKAVPIQIDYLPITTQPGTNGLGTV
jgi:hypothetical protein